MNNFAHKPDERNPRKPVTDLNAPEIKKIHEYGNAKQSMLTSNMDGHQYTAPPREVEKPKVEASPVKGNYPT